MNRLTGYEAHQNLDSFRDHSGRHRRACLQQLPDPCSTRSITQPRGPRRYVGGPSAAIAFFTVFFEHPSTRAMILIGIRSARYSLRISAQSSTLNTHFSLTPAEVSITKGVSFQLGAVKGSVSRPSTDPLG
jgi:hypothetical protein